MAKYDREFLVPYLHSLCALHIAEKKLLDHCKELATYRDQIKAGTNLPYPARRPDEPLVTGSIFAALAFGCICLIPCILCIAWGPLWGALLSGTFSIFLFWISIGSIIDTKHQNEANHQAYQRAYSEYHRVQKADEKEREKLPAIQEKLDKGIQDGRRITALIQETYNANVIPSRYRGFYPAVYLYDWFNTSRADDMDAALNMYVLEEIKSRLDDIISNQSEMILNQRVMIASQERSMEIQQTTAQKLHAKLDRIEASDEERNSYLKMIQSDVATNEFFASWNYFK